MPNDKPANDISLQVATSTLTMTTTAKVADPAGLMLLYLAFLGDADRTAAAAGVDVNDVRELASLNRWDLRVTQLRVVKRNEGADAFAQELNRTQNLVQAFRLRGIIDSVVKLISSSPSELDAFLTQVSPKGGKIKTMKPLMELTKAAQVVQSLTYAALKDTVRERLKEEQEGTDADGRVSLAILRALASKVADEIPELPPSEPKQIS
jgi:hypothetical protein